MSDAAISDEPFDEESIRKALEMCSEEPVHIPGRVQPFACLLAVTTDGRISHVSENSGELIGRSAQTLLGADAASVLGPDAWRAVRNQRPEAGAPEGSTRIGVFDIDGMRRVVSAFRSGERHIVEIEPDEEAGLSEAETVSTLVTLLSTLERCGTERYLLDLAPRLLRRVTGYDRVMVYRFDRDFNGEIVAEDRQPEVEPFLGLRFPHWDIPSQARAIMARLPLRFICDVDQVSSPLLAAPSETEPLDITFAASRGVSPVHMEYLRNMGTGATMTLSIVMNGELWGMISFHHRTPRTPAPGLRQILNSFISMFALKLQSLQQRRHIDLVAQVDEIGNGALDAIGEDDGANEVAEIVRSLIDADGVAISVGARTTIVGRAPGAALLNAIFERARAQPGRAVAVENLGEAFPELASGESDEIESAGGALAGALAMSTGRDRALAAFRRETIRNVSWAGAPEKKISVNDGLARLTPRASFAVYTEEMCGACEAWSERDRFLVKRIWTLIYEAERRELLHFMNRQQRIMIDELNHRVRNILTLIRSVSRQVKGDGGSSGTVDEYAKALEARIQSLATSHDLVSNALDVAAPLRKLLIEELAPYAKTGDGRFALTCGDLAISVEMAPILSLVIHELATNAVKYGALSQPGGHVVVSAVEEDGGSLVIRWREEGGPPVTPPQRGGFGTRLIAEAIPHEFDGATKIDFPPEGVTATIEIGSRFVSHLASPSAEPSVEAPVEPQTAVPPLSHVERALVMEDNFIIAEGVKAQLTSLGVGAVETVSNVEAGLEVIGRDRPDMAVLDVNLGGGRTSEDFALHLATLGVPFVFLTGYGEALEVDDRLSSAPRLTKPVADAALATALSDLTRSASL